MTFIDTARGYGDSERIVGQADRRALLARHRWERNFYVPA